MKHPVLLWAIFSLCLTAPLASFAARGVWLEAEGFEQTGGWLIEQQSFGQVGSAYLMAHGMGIPVDDAITTCTVPRAGKWTVWVRTRDWTAPWKRGTPAGRFQIVVNGTPLPETLGTNGEAWGWQKAGTLPLDKGSAEIALRDLTGFNGRCDALYLTDQPGRVPANDPAALAELRQKTLGTKRKDDPTVYDLAIAGGGISGICTAVAAIRSGAKVILIQDRSVLGGNNSSEIRVPMGGILNKPPYPRLGQVVKEIEPITGRPGPRPPEYFEDARKKHVFETCPQHLYRLVLNTRVFGIEKSESGKISAFLTRNIRTGEETRIRAKFFADCTDDAVIARMAGASVMYGRESRAIFGESLAPIKGDRQVMGMSIVWYCTRTPSPSAFPAIDWGHELDENTVYYVRSGDWEWETGQYRDQADETEYIRDYGLMTIFANWSYLKNHAARKAEWANERLAWISPLGGKRESYRVVGDMVLTQNDIEQRVIYPDATASATWNLDLHFPDPIHEAKFKEPFRSCAYHRNITKPYPVPFRCLYSKDIENLFLAGRHISVSHVAFASVRVMRTLGALGEVTGMAAALCAKHNISPRELHATRLDDLKEMMKRGVPPPPTYHPGGFGSPYEGYHFKDTGHLGVYPNPSPRLNEPSVKARIEALGVQHVETEKQRPSGY